MRATNPLANLFTLSLLSEFVSLFLSFSAHQHLANREPSRLARSKSGRALDEELVCHPCDARCQVLALVNLE